MQTKRPRRQDAGAAVLFTESSITADLAAALRLGVQGEDEALRPGEAPVVLREQGAVPLLQCPEGVGAAHPQAPLVQIDDIRAAHAVLLQPALPGGHADQGGGAHLRVHAGLQGVVQAEQGALTQLRVQEVAPEVQLAQAGVGPGDLHQVEGGVLFGRQEQVQVEAIPLLPVLGVARPGEEQVLLQLLAGDAGGDLRVDRGLGKDGAPQEVPGGIAAQGQGQRGQEEGGGQGKAGFPGHGGSPFSVAPKGTETGIFLYLILPYKTPQRGGL